MPKMSTFLTKLWFLWEQYWNLTSKLLSLYTHNSCKHLSIDRAGSDHPLRTTCLHLLDSLLLYMYRKMYFHGIKSCIQILTILISKVKVTILTQENCIKSNWDLTVTCVCKLFTLNWHVHMPLKRGNMYHWYVSFF